MKKTILLTAVVLIQCLISGSAHARRLVQSPDCSLALVTERPNDFPYSEFDLRAQEQLTNKGYSVFYSSNQNVEAQDRDGSFQLRLVAIGDLMPPGFAQGHWGDGVTEAKCGYRIDFYRVHKTPDGSVALANLLAERDELRLDWVNATSLEAYNKGCAKVLIRTMKNIPDCIPLGQNRSGD